MLSHAARSHFTPSCLALGTVGTPRKSWAESPAPSPRVVPQTLRRPLGGGPGAAGGTGRRAETSTQGTGAGRWKPSKFSPLLYKSHSKIINPQKLKPGSATGLLPRQPPERGLHSQPCTHARGGGKMPSGEASSTGRSGSQMFSYQRSFKKKKKGRARHEGRNTHHAERSLQNKYFSVSHQWKDQIRHPAGGLGRSRFPVPATAGRMLGWGDAACAAPCTFAAPARDA